MYLLNQGHTRFFIHQPSRVLATPSLIPFFLEKLSFLDYEIPRNRSTPETSSSSGVILGPYGNNGFWNEGFDSMESSTSQSRPSLASAPGGVVNPSFIGSDYYGNTLNILIFFKIFHFRSFNVPPLRLWRFFKTSIQISLPFSAISFK